jgi:hypothetical protein
MQPDNDTQVVVTQGQRWQHIKRGTSYEIISLAELQIATGDLVDGSSLILYRGDDGKLWAREEGEFTDGRFRLAPEPPAASTGAIPDGMVASIDEHDAYRIRKVAEADCGCRIPTPFDEVADHLAMIAFAEGVRRSRLAAAPTPPAPSEQPAPSREAPSWRCFHCGDMFIDERCARLHFGRDEDSIPACQIKAGAEQGLLGALREAEYAAADARQAIAGESTEAAQAYYAQATRHSQALRNAEEAGYERGLADGRAISEHARADAPTAERGTTISKLARPSAANRRVRRR